ncbi:hypothetical protein HQ587_06185 [bacterium]|nr:hypothetical protein [bacterium]
MVLLVLGILSAFLSVQVSYAQEKFYVYYDNGLEFLKKGDYLRAIEEFESAVSIEYEDKKKKRTYGTRFIKYYPHLQIGKCHYYIGETNMAQRELELALAYVKKNKEAREYLDKIAAGMTPAQELAFAEDKKRGKELEKQRIEEEKRRKEEEQKRLKEEEEQLRKEEEQRRQQEEEELRQEELVRDEEERQRLEEKRKQREAEELERKQAREAEKLARKQAREAKELALKEAEEKKKKTAGDGVQWYPSLPVGALTYDPSRVTRVGSRLTVAVMPVRVVGGEETIGLHVMEKMITQLVNLRRFRVLERSQLEKIMEEQSLSLSGMMDEAIAIEVGKLAAADAIILTSLTINPGYAKVIARVIETETGITVVAQDAESKNIDLHSIDKVIENLAVKIYNSMPLVEGYIVNIEGDEVYLDLGIILGIRKGSKMVAFREGKAIVHPVTGEELGKKVTMLGELIVEQVQEKMSVAVWVGEPKQTVNIGDKVVVK